jgi:hypothetical protein
MLERVVKLIESTTPQKSAGILFCNDYIIEDKVCIEFLEKEKILENNIFDKSIGTRVNLELSLPRLNAIGFYQDLEAFVVKSKNKSTSTLKYIYEIKQYNTSNHEFFIKFNAVIKLIDSILSIAKHSYEDANTLVTLMSIEERALIIPIFYKATNVSEIDLNLLPSFETYTNILIENNTERQKLFINELISFLYKVEEKNRFVKMISSIEILLENSINAFEFYLRSYSTNKLKIELDSKVIEFTQKIQSVINDSQTKLIAIPTAFVLVFTTFNFNELYSIKNLILIASLFIFSILLQIFINNQKSAINFLIANINTYRKSFKDIDIDVITSGGFTIIYKEVAKQKNRLRLVEVILWSIPLLICYLVIMLFIFHILSSHIFRLIIFLLNYLN